MHRFYLISFDISSDKIRRRVVKQLLAKASRVQKSVFEANLTDKEFLELRKKIDKLIKDETDSVRYYHLCKLCADNVIISGVGSYTVQEDVIVV